MFTVVLQYLRDQTDMLVVGVIGLQGTGKSTIMSLLSANTPEEDQRSVEHEQYLLLCSIRTCESDDKSKHNMNNIRQDK